MVTSVYTVPYSDSTLWDFIGFVIHVLTTYKMKLQAKIDRRRAKTKQSFYNDIGRIEKIAGGAKARAEQNQEKEEHKVKEKANKIRSTGKMPATCLCF